MASIQTQASSGRLYLRVHRVMSQRRLLGIKRLEQNRNGQK